MNMLVHDPKKYDSMLYSGDRYNPPRDFNRDEDYKNGYNAGLFDGYYKWNRLQCTVLCLAIVSITMSIFLLNSFFDKNKKCNDRKKIASCYEMISSDQAIENNTCFNSKEIDSYSPNVKDLPLEDWFSNNTFKLRNIKHGRIVDTAPWYSRCSFKIEVLDHRDELDIIAGNEIRFSQDAKYGNEYNEVYEFDFMNETYTIFICSSGKTHEHLYGNKRKIGTSFNYETSCYGPAHSLFWARHSFENKSLFAKIKFDETKNMEVYRNGDNKLCVLFSVNQKIDKKENK